MHLLVPPAAADAASPACTHQHCPLPAAQLPQPQPARRLVGDPGAPPVSAPQHLPPHQLQLPTLQPTLAGGTPPPCELCGQAQARVYCPADVAALCMACDARLHAANPFFHRHRRVLAWDPTPAMPAPAVPAAAAAAAAGAAAAVSSAAATAATAPRPQPWLAPAPAGTAAPAPAGTAAPSPSAFEAGCAGAGAWSAPGGAWSGPAADASQGPSQRGGSAPSGGSSSVNTLTAICGDNPPPAVTVTPDGRPLPFAHLPLDAEALRRPLAWGDGPLPTHIPTQPSAHRRQLLSHGGGPLPTHITPQSSAHRRQLLSHGGGPLPTHITPQYSAHPALGAFPEALRHPMPAVTMEAPPSPPPPPPLPSAVQPLPPARQPSGAGFRPVCRAAGAAACLGQPGLGQLGGSPRAPSPEAAAVGRQLAPPAGASEAVAAVPPAVAAPLLGAALEHRCCAAATARDHGRLRDGEAGLGGRAGGW